MDPSSDRCQELLIKVWLPGPWFFAKSHRPPAATTSGPLELLERNLRPNHPVWTVWRFDAGGALHDEQTIRDAMDQEVYRDVPDAFLPAQVN